MKEPGTLKPLGATMSVLLVGVVVAGLAAGISMVGVAGILAFNPHPPRGHGRQGS